MGSPALFCFLASLCLVTCDPNVLSNNASMYSSELWSTNEQILVSDIYQHMGVVAETSENPDQSSAWQISKGVGKLEIKLDLEGFGIRPWASFAQANFSIAFKFQVGPDSHPKNIVPLAGQKYIDEKAAMSGLARWTLDGLEKEEWYVMVLNYKHMIGFTSLFILSDQVSITVRINKDWKAP